MYALFACAKNKMKELKQRSAEVAAAAAHHPLFKPTLHLKRNAFKRVIVRTSNHVAGIANLTQPSGAP
jgi:hypothetical protein